MKKIIVVLFCSLLVVSCGKKTPRKQPPVSTDYTLAQLDSIGKAYTPEIGTYGGTVWIPLGADPDGFCPATSTSAYSNSVMGYIFEGLVELDIATLTFTPRIAEKWDVSDDGLQWTFHLRNDVFFSDGVKLSAYDVAFTFNDVIYNKKIRSGLADNFKIKGKKITVTAVDSFTVTFTLPYPFAPFLTVAGMDIMPKHVYAKYAKDGTLESFLSSGTDPKNVIGSGPFILDKVELGQRVVMKRNPNYWKKDAKGNRLPYIDRLIMLIIKEPNVAMLKFKNGEIDQLSVQGEHYPILKPLEKEKGFTLYKVGPRWYDSFFTFNQNNQKNPKTGKFYLEEKKQKWFRNKYFRKACAHAINYQAMIEIIYNGLATPPDGVWGKHKGFFHNPNAPTYDYDVDKAKKLLAEQGFKDRDGDGFLEDSDGNLVEFTLITSAGVKIIQKMFEMVRKDLEKIGMKVHLNFVEFNNLIDKTNNTYDWDAVAYALGGIIDPHFGKSTEIYSSYRYIYNPKQKKPSYPWEARVAEIFEEAASEMDPEKRKKLYWEWQEIVMDQCLKVYMPLREVVLGVKNHFGNIHLTRYLGLEGAILHNMEEIYIKEPGAQE